MHLKKSSMVIHMLHSGIWTITCKQILLDFVGRISLLANNSGCGFQMILSVELSEFANGNSLFFLFFPYRLSNSHTSWDLNLRPHPYYILNESRSVIWSKGCWHINSRTRWSFDSHFVLKMTTWKHSLTFSLPCFSFHEELCMMRLKSMCWGFNMILCRNAFCKSPFCPKYVNLQQGYFWCLSHSFRYL